MVTEESASIEVLRLNFRLFLLAQAAFWSHVLIYREKANS